MQPTFFYPDTPELPLPTGHRFPASKYRLLRELVTSEDVLTAQQMQPAHPATVEQLCRVHDAQYVNSVMDGTLDPKSQRRIGLPWSETLTHRSRATVGGTLSAARCALQTGIAGQLAGGTHHAHHDFGSGFCTFNDFAVTADELIGEGACTRVATVDLDVHQGDGNAAMLAGRPDVFVASVHGDKNFPFRKVDSDLDIGLADGTTDADYCEAVATALDAVFTFKPDLILYNAGVDPLQADRLGRLDVSHDGLAQRDRQVLTRARRAGVPVVVVAGGGYADPITLSVAAYANTVRIARSVYGF